MFLRYLSVLCLFTSSLFAASFTFDFAATIKNDVRLVKFNNIRFGINENKPYILTLANENLNFNFTVLEHDEETVTVQTTITPKSTENNESSILAQPSMRICFNQTAILNFSVTNNEETYHFELTLIPSKNSN